MHKNFFQRSKGLIFAFISMFLGALATIFFKPVMNEGVSPLTVGLLECVSIILFLAVICKPWRLIKSNKRILQPTIMASICQAIGSISFIFGLYYSDPVTFSFLSRNQAVFSIFLGYIFLRERHGAITWAFLILAIIGSFTLCYSDIGFMSPLGIIFAVLFCLSFSIRNFIWRKYPRMPVFINIFYGYVIFLALLIAFSIAENQTIAMPATLEQSLIIIGTSFFCMLGTQYFFQLAFRLEKLSVISPIRLFSPFIITLYFGWGIGYNYPPVKLAGIVIMSLAIITLLYSYKLPAKVKVTENAVENA